MSPEVLAAVSGVTGVGVGAIITRYALNNWLKGLERTKELAEKTHVDMVRVDERLKRLDHIEKVAHDCATAMAVHGAKLDRTATDVNNIGRKLQAFMDLKK